jgi:hypothetical protein
MWASLILLAATLLVVEATHYRAHDAVHIIANTIGPFNNPTETYPVSYFFFVEDTQLFIKLIISGLANCFVF